MPPSSSTLLCRDLDPVDVDTVWYRYISETMRLLSVVTTSKGPINSTPGRVSCLLKALLEVAGGGGGGGSEEKWVEMGGGKSRLSKMISL